MSELPRLFDDVARWYAVTTVALGVRTGLIDALLGGGGTCDELATAAGVDRDNAARWADAMVAGGYATADNGQYVANEETLGLLRGGAALDVRAIVELLVPLGSLLPRVATAIRDGAGIKPEEFQAAFGMTAERVNEPMYRAFLLDEWIGGHPELRLALEGGIDVAEVGPGGGTALRILAGAFPRSRFVGFDIDAATVSDATAAAAAEGLVNLRFEVLDGGAMQGAAFDLVCMFDAFHHLTDPDAVLVGMRRALRPGGSLLLAETSLSGDPSVDAADPTAVIVYGSDLLYCYQESKVAGDPGMGSTWPGRGLTDLLGRHGFSEVGRVASQAGYAVIRAMPTAG
ncbi:MAG: class I SAM-dependent methyltransferase [Candidatus Limnocylindrales bacterium]